MCGILDYYGQEACKEGVIPEEDNGELGDDEGCGESTTSHDSAASSYSSTSYGSGDRTATASPSSALRMDEYGFVLEEEEGFPRPAYPLRPQKAVGLEFVKGTVWLPDDIAEEDEEAALLSTVKRSNPSRQTRGLALNFTKTWRPADIEEEDEDASGSADEDEDGDPVQTIPRFEDWRATSNTNTPSHALDLKVYKMPLGNPFKLQPPAPRPSAL